MSVSNSCDGYESNEDDIFFLLNGIRDKGQHGSSDVAKNKLCEDDSEFEMFVDANGEPTDAFLESLKRDPITASDKLNRKLQADENSRSCVIGNFTQPRARYHSHYFSSSSESDDESIIGPNDSHIHFSRQRKSRENPLRHTKPRSRSKSCHDILSTRSSVGKSLERPSPLSAKKPKLSATSSKKPKRPSSAASSMSIKQNKGSIATSRSKTPTVDDVRSSQSRPRNRPIESSTTTLRQSDDKTERLRLRVQGQLNSIRVLETQLAEAQHTIAKRDLELAEALKRIHRLEARENTDKANLKDRSIDKEIFRNGKNNESKMYQLKTEILAVQARFNDEKSRRTRAEERLRVVRDHFEKQKKQSAELEQKNAELSEEVESTRAKLVKKKQEVKATARDIHNERSRFIEKDCDLQNCKSRLENAERRVKELNMDNDRLKKEVRQLRRELGASEDHNRRKRLEIEVLKERQNTAKLSSRLNERTGKSTRRLSEQQDSSYKADSPAHCNESSVASCPYSRTRGGHGRIYNEDESEESSSVDTFEIAESYLRKEKADKESTFGSSYNKEDDNPIENFGGLNSALNRSLQESDVTDSRQVSDENTSISVLKEEAHLGEQFNRLQKMYNRVQGRHS